jgi:hypothetical protein
MKSREIVKKLNDLIDLVQEDIEETKKHQNLEPFIFHMKALKEMKYALDLAKKYIVSQIEPQPSK